MDAILVTEMDALAMQDSISTGQISLLSSLVVIEWVELEPVGNSEGYMAVLVLARDTRVIVQDTNKGRPRVWKNAGNAIDLLASKGVVLDEATIRLKVKK